jgi:hypothetical protein
MKHLLLAPLAALFALPAAAQQPGFQADAILVEPDGGNVRIWVVAATSASIRYRDSAVSSVTNDLKLTPDTAIFFLEPAEFTTAMNQFQARKYKEALAGFTAIKTRFKPVEALPGNHSTLAGFYEMECLRKLGNLEGLVAANKAFNKDALIRETQQGQLDLNILWEAAHSQSWPRLEILARDREELPLPGSHKAQVAYLLGLALEGQERPLEALNAFNTALIADAGASEDIARQAALKILAIHKADPEVQAAISRWGTPAESKGSAGFFRLTEAAAVAHLYELSLGGETPLPADFKEFLKYRTAA